MTARILSLFLYYLVGTLCHYRSVLPKSRNGYTLAPVMLNLMRRPTVTPAQLAAAFAELGLDGRQHAIVHASLRSFGQLQGGSKMLLDELLRATATLSAPAFTYSTLLPTPTSAVYTHFHPKLHVSRDIGRLPQQMVEHPAMRRSFHPALSFVAIGSAAEQITSAQSLESPYSPIGALYDLDGVALLLGVDHSSNTSIHYGEYLAGMPLLTRYVPLGGRVVATSFPNCSSDFENIAPYVHERRVTVGRATLRAYRVRDLVDSTVKLLTRQPEALLCTYAVCRCREVRKMLRQDGLHPRSHQDTAPTAPSIRSA